MRLHAIFENYIEGEFGDRIAAAVKASQGVEIPVHLRGSHAFSQFFRKSEIRDILDFVTTVTHVLQDARYRKLWLESIATIFQEEHLGYRVDASGIVHPYIDQQFELTQRAAIEALNHEQFRQARDEFEAAFRHLRGRENTQALRMMFPAVETATKVLFPGKFAGLSPNEVEKHIKPVLVARYAGNQPAIDAGRRLLEGMKAWINAAQPYRHGQEQQERAEAPVDFVIAHLTAGAAYLRWVIDLCSA